MYIKRSPLDQCALDTLQAAHPKVRRIAALLPLALLSAASAWAQTPPDAGALQQQIERERQQKMPKRLAPEKPADPAALKPTGQTVTVSAFRFAGNTLLSAEQLAPVVSPYLNRPLDFNQLQAAAAAVAGAYREADWIVRAYLPAQDIKDGAFTIQIVEAVFGGARLEGSTTRVSGDRILGMVASQLPQGGALNATALDRALLLTDDLPGVAVRGRLAEGAREREAVLTLSATDESLFAGDVALDNTGPRSTGSDRVIANLALNSPAGWGDQVTANLIHSRGSDYVRVGYSLPIGYDGLRIGLNTSELRYRLIVDPFDSKTDKGRSTSRGLDASYPLVRSRLANLYASLAYDHKTFDNEIAGATSTRYKIDNLTLTLSGNLFDNWGGGGANSASLAYTSGKRDNQVGTTNDQFSKLRYSLARQQVLTPKLALFGQIAGQELGDALDSSEKFYLGGSNGVRAYPANEGGGNSGVLGTLELRWTLPYSLTATLFLDAGHVRDGVGPSYGLSGSGIALGWQGPAGLNLKATLARRHGNNPNPAANGKDQDGSLDMNRLWLTASLPF